MVNLKQNKKMKKIVYALICALCSISITSCDETMWETDDLVETNVWTMTYVSSSEVLYFYPEYSFYITENGLTLEIVEMSDWAINEDDEGNINVSLNSHLPKDNDLEVDSMRFTIDFNSENLEGTIYTQYFSNGSEETSLAQSSYINGFEQSLKLIESRE